MMGEATNAGSVDEVTHVSGRPSTASTAGAKAKLEPQWFKEASTKKHQERIESLLFS